MNVLNSPKGKPESHGRKSVVRGLLAIKGTDGEREVDYSSLSQKVIQKKIKGYEKKHGSFARFFKVYDCEDSPPDDYLTLIDWGCLLNE